MVRVAVMGDMGAASLLGLLVFFLSLLPLLFVTMSAALTAALFLAECWTFIFSIFSVISLRKLAISRA